MQGSKAQMIYKSQPFYFFMLCCQCSLFNKGGVIMIVKKIRAFVAIFALCSGLAAFADSTTVDDAAITTKVKAALLGNKMVSGLEISVETNQGVVALQGQVKTESEAHTAIEIAASTRGVVDVDASKLTVKAGEQHPLVDSMITAKVKGVYLREKLFGDKPTNVTQIHVETKDGVVYLTGKANSETQAKNAQELAKGVKGVKEVKSNVKVEN